MHLLQFLPLVSLATAAALHSAATRITLTPTKRFQTIDGFGFSAAFQRANLMIALQPAAQKSLLDLLFNTTTGAGFSILRNGIGSSPDSSLDYMNSILPKSPGSPSATPNYVWDGKDSGQLWLSQQAVSYGVSTVYANAWSAPGFMKTNNDDRNGGSLCGVPGASCASGDWRQRYADYLVQYVKFYQAASVNITHLAFLNEPDLSTSYASMRSDANQAADFIKLLRPTLDAAGYQSIQIACCEATGWNVAQQHASGLQSAGVVPNLGVLTGHAYTSGINGPINTPLHVWQSEYSDLSGQWTTAWDGDGIKWAQTLHTALTTGNVNGYLWWEGVQGPNPNTNEKLILVNGQQVTVAKRFWAFAQYSRSIRPGAVRIDAQGSGLTVTAYENKDGSVAVLVLNTGNSVADVVLAGVKAGAAKGWLTSNSQDMAVMSVLVATDGTVVGTVPARALASFVITPAAPAYERGGRA